MFQVAVVAPEVRNPASQTYLLEIEKLFNENRIRYVSLGILSLYWKADESSDVALPRATVPFLQPAWLTWHQRIVEISFWGRFWNLEREHKDYDVNPSEWETN